MHNIALVGPPRLVSNEQASRPVRVIRPFGQILSHIALVPRYLPIVLGKKNLVRTNPGELTRESLAHLIHLWNIPPNYRKRRYKCSIFHPRSARRKVGMISRANRRASSSAPHFFANPLPFSCARLRQPRSRT